MNVWAQMIRALKGEASEAGEKLLDSQAIRILDNEVKVASLELKQSRSALTELMAKQIVAKERVDSLTTKIQQHEGYALQALGNGDEALALEVAEKIVTLEADKVQEASICEAYTDSLKDLQHIIKQAEMNLKRLKQQLDTIKATESVQRAQASVAGRQPGSIKRMQTAQESLERLKERQSLKAAHFEAVKATDGNAHRDALLDKLEKAGIVTGSSKANEVLARLKSN